jgi:transposase-like protein
LIAISDSKPIGYLKCGRENYENWAKFLSSFVPPKYVVCDGQKGMLSAIKKVWQNKTIIQRCLVHVKRNIITDITQNPKLDAGVRLKTLLLDMLKVKSLSERDEWIDKFKTALEEAKHFLSQRTYSKDNKKWWYTHHKIRSAYRRLNVLINDKVIFNYLDDSEVDKTSNAIEGGKNSRIATLIRSHPGLSQYHKEKMVEIYLLIKSNYSHILY